LTASVDDAAWRCGRSTGCSRLRPRGGSDRDRRLAGRERLEYEFQMALMNRNLAPGIERCSSSGVRSHLPELEPRGAKWRASAADVSQLVTPVQKALKQKFGEDFRRVGVRAGAAVPGAASCPRGNRRARPGSRPSLGAREFGVVEVLGRPPSASAIPDSCDICEHAAPTRSPRRGGRRRPRAPLTFGAASGGGRATLWWRCHLSTATRSAPRSGAWASRPESPR